MRRLSVCGEDLGEKKREKEEKRKRGKEEKMRRGNKRRVEKIDEK